MFIHRKRPGFLKASAFWNMCAPVHSAVQRFRDSPCGRRLRLVARNLAARSAGAEGVRDSGCFLVSRSGWGPCERLGLANDLSTIPR